MLVLVLMSGWISGITPVSQAKVIGVWLFNEGKGNVAKDSAGTGLTWRSSKGSGLKVEAHLMEPWDLVWQHMLGSRSKRKTQSLTLIKENSRL